MPKRQKATTANHSVEQTAPDRIKRTIAFRAMHVNKHKSLYHELAKGQQPDFFVIACSDSRVKPGDLLQSGPGEILNARNPGNIVPPYPSQDNVWCAVELALGMPSIKRIIICGHTDCGAMKLLLQGVDARQQPVMHHWLKNTGSVASIVARKYPHLKTDPQARAIAAACENVMQQLEHLKSHPGVAQRLEEGTLSVYGWMYEIHSGTISEIDAQDGVFVPLNHDTHELPVGPVGGDRLAPGSDPVG